LAWAHKEGTQSHMPHIQSAAINLRLAQLGLPLPEGFEETESARLARPILARQRELSRRLADRLCAADGRIQEFLDDYLAETGECPQLPRRTLVLDEPGLARDLSLPFDGDSFTSPLMSSYRLVNGVLHNPANDRRTTAGVFHIAEGGLAIPDDKIAVPKVAFARLLSRAFEPPEIDRVLPYSASQPQPAGCFVSLYLRPLVSPEVPGSVREKRMETRFIVPGGLVANLDFVEGIFGNGGDPYLPENDASLAPETWTGHTGCVLLAPHLTRLTKQELGLPSMSEATDRQKRDGMCWEHEDELYNGGRAFKICARDARGVIVTVIADTYFGYCKKEIKTQISYSANLFGNAEEEHAGGALVFASYNLGQEYTETSAGDSYTVAEVLERDPGRFAAQPQGHALDLQQPHIVLVPANPHYSLGAMTVSWSDASGEPRSIPLRADQVYLSPNGYRVEIAQQPHDRTAWSLIGTVPNPTSCHKPATVSGGGKSEISKAITDAFIFGSEFVADFDTDMDSVAAILDRDFSRRFLDPAKNGQDDRPILSEQRSIGSVIKLLTPSRSDYHADYNAWLDRIPPYIKELVYVVQRSYRQEWGDDWRSHFSVAAIDGRQGNRLRLDGDRISINMLRVGYNTDGSWRLFSLRHDFSPAVKVQTQDDITASTVVPGGLLGMDPARSFKLVENCEDLLFQRPDDAIHRGYDKQAERDIATPGTFLSNFAPSTRDDAVAMRDDAVAFSAFSEPMAQMIGRFADTAQGDGPAYFVCSANPRMVEGKPSKNPRYLQQRPDRTNAKATAVAELSARLLRRLPSAAPLLQPVEVVAAGRRNNPPDGPVPPLCSYSPLHYMELPELFMEFISSMTGKSPSTTGAGSEGALTKGPFNAMPAIIDLNASLLSFALTGYDGWVSAAGYVGPHVQVDHDFSLLVPELFSRMTPDERDARNLIAEGALEKLTDFEHDGQCVPASRLGYRMTDRLATKYFGRIFLHPDVVFTPEMLRPELQDVAIFAESIATIVTTHERVARSYFEDGTIALAVPPLRALLEIMAEGCTAAGWGLDSPEFRAMFTRETILASDWYAQRLDAKQAAASARANAGLAAIEKFVSTPGNEEPAARLDMPARVQAAREEAQRLAGPEFREQLVGTAGSTPL
jgi:phosphoenolpyruvate carboxykinase (diphosphate)